MTEKVASDWGTIAVRLLGLCVRGLKLDPKAAKRLWINAKPHLPTLEQRRIDSILYLACEIDSVAQNAYDKVWRQQRPVLRSLLERMVDEGLRPALFKGAEIVERCYDSRAIAFLADADILVPPQDIPAATRILRNEGFQQTRFEPANDKLVNYTPNQLHRIEASHYELASYRKLVALEFSVEEYAFFRKMMANPEWPKRKVKRLPVTIDVHFALANDIDVTPLFSRLVPSAFGVGYSLCAADHLWFLLCRFYNEVAIEGERCLHPLVYAAGLLASEPIDWDIVLSSAREYELRPALFYYLSFLSRLDHRQIVPEGVLQELLPTHGSRYRDWGWQIGKLLDTVEPMPFDPRDLTAKDHDRFE